MRKSYRLIAAVPVQRQAGVQRHVWVQVQRQVGVQVNSQVHLYL